MSGLRVAMFGTPAFAVPTLEALVASPQEVVGVVTQPDRPRGRGRQIAPGPVKAVAQQHGLWVLQPERLRQEIFEEDFDALRVDLAVVAAYGKILPSWLLGKPRLGFINVHASLLPRHRGASPVHHAVMAGDEETGVTIMRVIEALDAGPMLAQRRLRIGLDETAADIESTLATLGAAAAIETIDRMAAGTIPEVAQDDSKATYAPRLTKVAGLVDWSRRATDIHNQVRGLTPWPRAYSFLDGARLILRRARVAYETPPVTAPGTIVKLASGGAGVVCGDHHFVELLQVQPEGKKVMSGHDAMAGRILLAGGRFDPR